MTAKRQPPGYNPSRNIGLRSAGDRRVPDGPALRPEQSRMARAALEWSREDAAKAAGVSRRTVLRFERNHRDVKPELIEAILRAYEVGGVRFLDDGPHAGAVVPPTLRMSPAQ